MAVCAVSCARSLPILGLLYNPARSTACPVIVFCPEEDVPSNETFKCGGLICLIEIVALVSYGFWRDSD